MADCLLKKGAEITSFKNLILNILYYTEEKR